MEVLAKSEEYSIFYNYTSITATSFQRENSAAVAATRACILFVAVICCGRDYVIDAYIMSAAVGWSSNKEHLNRSTVPVFTSPLERQVMCQWTRIKNLPRH